MPPLLSSFVQHLAYKVSPGPEGLRTVPRGPVAPSQGRSRKALDVAEAKRTGIFGAGAAGCKALLGTLMPSLPKPLGQLGEGVHADVKHVGERISPSGTHIPVGSSGGLLPSAVLCP